jgi:hypothetical protein
MQRKFDQLEQEKLEVEAQANVPGQAANLSAEMQVPPEDHIKLSCTAALWINPLVAPRSFFVCARKLAQKHTSIPAEMQVPALPPPLRCVWTYRDHF